MTKKIFRQLHDLGLLSLNVEKDIWRSREEVARCVANYPERKQGESMCSTGSRNEFRFHIDRGCAHFARHVISLLAGNYQRGDGQKISELNRQARKERTPLVQVK